VDLGIRGRTGIVCGASRGLGRACAAALAREGVALTIVARGSAALAAAAQEIAAASGVAVTPVAADVTTQEGRTAVLAACPVPDILVNNADGRLPGDFRTWTREDWIDALDTMMLCHIEMMRLVVDGMMARGFGRIVNIVSRSVKIPQIELGLSNGARSGLVGFAAGLARETVARNVTINNLLPGIFDSNAQRGARLGDGCSERQDLRGAVAGARRRQSGPALRMPGGARRLLRLPVWRQCRLHHRPEPADRRRQLSGDILSRSAKRRRAHRGGDC
jgi:3-oxoacyl-[acyl-carrier protein] reductase